MIYLDYQATTPLAPEAREAMLPYVAEQFGNPHSPHRLGRRADAAIERARDQVNGLLGGQGGRGYFTGSATEAANWALKGLLLGEHGKRRNKVVTLPIEHACILDTLRFIERQDVEIVTLPVGRHGLVDLEQAAALIDDRTALVCAMLVNNEIGVIQPVEKLGQLARSAGALLLCDAVQAFGRVPIPIDACDMVLLSAHKLHGPKGIGYLWKRDGVELTPLLHGGGQEGGERSGTLSPALCAGFGAAAAVAGERRETDRKHVGQLWERALGILGDDWIINGAIEPRYHGNLNVRLPGLDASRLLSDVRTVAFSSGSACASGSGRPSHVLQAIGLDRAEANSSIRLGWGRYTTTDELTEALTMIDRTARTIAGGNR